MSHYELKCQKCGKKYNSPNKDSVACVWCVKQIIHENHCLDKQRVKEAISKLTLTGYRGNPEGYVNAKNLLKEIGLEDEEWDNNNNENS